MLKKSDVPAPPRLKHETVNVPELGGEVLLRGMLLSDRLTASMADGFKRIATILSACVSVDGGKDKDGKEVGMVPVYSVEEWDSWGNANYVAAMNLWSKISDMSDLSGDQAAKKSSAQKSSSAAA